MDGAETAINEDLDRDHAFIETFGAIQLWMGRRVVQDVDPSSTVVKLSTGALTFVDLSARYVDTAPHAEALADFADRLETHGIPLLYVNAPQKIPRNSDLLPAGVTEYGNEVGDRLLEDIGGAGRDPPWICGRPLRGRRKLCRLVFCHGPPLEALGRLLRLPDFGSGAGDLWNPYGGAVAGPGQL